MIDVKSEEGFCTACTEHTYSFIGFNELEGEPLICARCVYTALNPLVVGRHEAPDYLKEWRKK